jgi:hypothetical protein
MQYKSLLITDIQFFPDSVFLGGRVEREEK